MTIYLGNDLSKILIDRLALDYPFETLKSDYESLLNAPFTFTKSELNTWAEEHKDEINARRSEFLKLFESSLPFNQIDSLRRELTELKAMAYNDKNLKAYVQLSDQLLKAIDVYVKTLNAFKEKRVEINISIAESNWRAIEELARDNLITINDPDTLQTLFGIKKKSEVKVES